jgi:hypothetical protein
MFWLKSCPRCHGDLHENTDVYGGYIDCFQCGHYLTAEEDATLRSENPQGKAHALTPDESAKPLAGAAA